MSFKARLNQIAAAALLAGASAAQAALLGLTPAEPTVDFGSGGVISYNASTGVVTISGTPATLFQTEPFIFGTILGTGTDNESLITVQFKVDSTGAFVSGVDGPDLIVKGSVDTDFDGVADHDGVLLEAEVAQFGFEDGGAADDQFDLRLNSVGGLLANLFANQDLAMRVVSENSTEYPAPFNGSFGASFAGLAKGVIGATSPLVSQACHVKVETFCSVSGMKMSTSCRIDVAKSPKHWDFEDRQTCGGHSYRRYSYGMHGQPMPAWGHRVATTNVTFKYVVTNVGDVPVSGLMVDDAFDTAVSGVPAGLAVGQSVILMRTEKLSDTLDNTVLVNAQNGSAVCAATDTVVVKEKLRDRRRHDDDRYKEKDDHESHGHRR